MGLMSGPTSGAPPSGPPVKSKHRRGNSFFRSFSGGDKMVPPNIDPKPTTTHQSSRFKPTHRATLTQTYIEKPAWDKDGPAIGSRPPTHRNSSLVGELESLRIAGLDKNSSSNLDWEAEITTELDRVRSKTLSYTNFHDLDKAILSGTESHPPSPPTNKSVFDPTFGTKKRHSALARPYSNSHSDALISSKHSSTVSTVSTLRHFSFISTDGPALASRLCIGTTSPDSDSPEDEDDCESTDGEKHVGYVVVPEIDAPPSPESLYAPATQPDPLEQQSESINESSDVTVSSTRSIVSETSVATPVSATSNSTALNAPSESLASSPSHTLHKKDTAGSSSQLNNASMLSYKKEHIKYRKNVSKASISSPTGLVDYEHHFASSPERPSKAYKPRNSIIAGISIGLFKPSKRESTMFVEPRTPQSSTSCANLKTYAPPHHHHQPANSAGRKNSFVDIRKSFMSKPPTSAIFRNASGLSSRKSFLGFSSGSGNGGNGSSSNDYYPSSPIEKHIISLPTPIDTSREKLKNKLRASTSLMSLTRNNTSQGSLAIAVPVAQHNLTQLETLLSMCKTPSILDFQAYVDRAKYAFELTKASDSQYCEIFHQDSTAAAVPPKVYKIIPFGSEELDQFPVEQVLKELSIASKVMRLDSFVDIHDIAVVKGTYPPYLQSLWDQHAAAGLPSAATTNPQIYDENQLYCVIVQKYAGVDLSKFPLESWTDAESVFWQTVAALAQAETLCQYEHRNLNWTNIVIQDRFATGRRLSESSGQTPTSPTVSSSGGSTDVLDEVRIVEELQNMLHAQSPLRVTLVDYNLSRATDDSGAPIYTRLDHPDFYKGKGDYQFDIYQFMRSYFVHSHRRASDTNGHGHHLPTTPSSAYFRDSDDTVVDWGAFYPRTNVLWLHYLATKLVSGKGLARLQVGKNGRVTTSGSNGSNGSSPRPAFEGELLVNEARACRSLETVASALEPRRKHSASSGSGSTNGSSTGSSASDSAGAGSGASAGATVFAELGSATEVLKWGIRTKLFPASAAGTAKN